ncbi:MAG: hypothetical protein HYX60_10880 [Legionella longbeachae]|nr:hypothetical protein [Legionella longbeachae]
MSKNGNTSENKKIKCEESLKKALEKRSFFCNEKSPYNRDLCKKSMEHLARTIKKCTDVNLNEIQASIYNK